MGFELRGSVKVRVGVAVKVGVRVGVRVRVRHVVSQGHRAVLRCLAVRG